MSAFNTQKYHGTHELPIHFSLMTITSNAFLNQIESTSLQEDSDTVRSW